MAACVESTLDQDISTLVQHMSDNNLLQQFEDVPYGIGEREREFYDKNVRLTRGQIGELCAATLNQSNGAWRRARKIRITASNCYSLYTYGKGKGADWGRKIRTYLRDFDLSGNPAVQYGVRNESVARGLYEKSEGVEVKRFGICVSRHAPFLACSPDGIVFKDGRPDRLVEIKCPYISRDVDLIQLVKNRRVPYLFFERGRLYMKKKHNYFAQVQLALCILNLRKCDFIILSQTTYMKIEIERDDEFLLDLLVKLKSVYFGYMLSVCMEIPFDKDDL